MRQATEELLEAANGPNPDPQKVWSLIDESIKGLFGSYDDFAARFEQTPLHHDDVEWDLGDSAFAGPDIFLAKEIAHFCGAEVRDASWEFDVFFPRAEGLSAGAAQLFFVGRSDGVKLWLVY